MKREVQANQPLDQNNTKGLAAFTLVVAEAGLGSILHGLHVPFSGHFLSLNQIFFLSHFGPRSRDAFFSFEVSTIAALFKVLSPAGKRLTPMLAICAQGALHNLGMLLLPGIWGCLMGATLASLWAFVQPLALYSLFYGGVLVEMARFYIERVGLKGKEDALLLWIALLVGLKLVLSWLAVWAAFRWNEKKIRSYQQALLQVGNKVLANRAALPEGPRQPLWKRITRELFRPLFLLSLALTLFFIYQAEAAGAARWWVLLRPLAIGAGLFFVFQALPWEKLVMRKNWGALGAFLSEWRDWQQGQKR